MMRYVVLTEADEAVLAGKFAVMRRLLDERQWRVYLGTEALALGRAGGAGVGDVGEDRGPRRGGGRR